MINITILVELQKIYDDEQSLKKKLKDSQDSIKLLKQQLDLITKEKQETDEKMHQLSIKLKDENLKLQTEEANLKKYNHELYTTQQSNPRYLKELDLKIQDLGKVRETEEETILYLLDEIDQIKNKQILLQQQQNEIQEAHDMKIKSHESIENIIKEDLFNHSMKKESLRNQFEDDTLQLFDRTMLHCQGKAVAVLTNDQCSICRFSIPLSQIDQIKKNKDQIHYCSNCKRILIAL